jgi:hypothetical protein
MELAGWLSRSGGEMGTLRYRIIVSGRLGVAGREAFRDSISNPTARTPR